MPYCEAEARQRERAEAERREEREARAERARLKAEQADRAAAEARAREEERARAEAEATAARRAEEALRADELAAQRSEAFCALRDPDREIRLLSPEYERHISLVRTITRASRAKLLDEVPFPIHFDELGQHTLYVVLSNKREVLGYVHVRSEHPCPSAQ